MPWAEIFSRMGSTSLLMKSPSAVLRVDSVPDSQEELDERRVRRQIGADLGEQPRFFEERALLARARLGDVDRCE